MDCNSKRKWNKVSRANPCPICEHPDWCLFSGPIDSPDAVICARVESQKRVGSKGAGWLHRLRDDPFRPQRQTRRVSVAPPPAPAIMFAALATQFASAMSMNHLNMLADKLGVTVESLEALQVGYSVQHGAYSFPMLADHGKVRGIRLRTVEGQKFSVKGGREGLFIPSGVGPAFPFGGGGQLMICEGPTDCGALFDLGFNVVGRPSCSGGVQLVVDLVCDWHPDGVAIIADADAPGQRGARYLASRLVGYVASGVRVVTPPAGVKDAREWVRRGASRDDVHQAIEAAPLLQLHYGVKAVAL